MASKRRKGRQASVAYKTAGQPKRPKSKQCEATGKLGYRSQVDAATAMAGLSRRGGLVRAYYCRHCERWHLTSKPKREKS